MYLLHHQRVVRGLKISNLLLLIGISGMQHFRQKKRQKVVLLIFYLFMRFMQIKPNIVNSACKWLIFHIVFKRD